MSARRLLIIALLLSALSADAAERDATQIVRDAVNHWRGLSSYTVMTMVIHRPDWERTMTLESWSEGDDLSLVRVIQPKRDAGNATLLFYMTEQGQEGKKAYLERRKPEFRKYPWLPW